MKENEAKMKWCPFARVPVYDSKGSVKGVASTNRVEGKPGPGTTCLGRGCMAWRWATELMLDGYCGLAGSPWGEP